MAEHEMWELKQMQALPLKAKIIMTEQRIKSWYEHWDGNVYVSFSGGKDSTVLKHIVDSLYDDVPSVFVDTGLEYPEIKSFVKGIKEGAYECFNSDIEIIKPSMRFNEVVKNYGYPVPSKEIAKKVNAKRRGVKWAEKYFDNTATDRNGNRSRYIVSDRWRQLLDAPFDVSDRCCYVMKKSPLKKYGRKTKRKPMVGMLAEESTLRTASWLKNGCNAFDSKRPISSPMAFWTEQDILHYIKENNVPYASIYGDIVPYDADSIQVTVYGILGNYNDTKLKTTRADRTGCIFCMFGCHLEKEPNRFQRLKQSHPKQWDYCINGGEMVDGKLQPNKDGLGLGVILDYIGVDKE